jgi:hypothetical protein
MDLRIRLTVVAIALALAALLPVKSSAFVSNNVTWAQSPVPFVINTTNMDGLSDAAVVAAVRAGADTWPQQSGAPIAFSYTGPSTQTVNTNDGINVVMFRNASSGSAIATTYTWMSGSRIIDADIVFWDAAFQFFTGSTGCSNGFYIEDIAAHEFGHALGLGHSTTPTATMYPSTAPCNTGLRSLDPDDIAGVRSLYPLTLQPPAPPSGLHVVR